MIEINNLTNFAVDRKSFTQVAKIVLKGENRVREKISLAFVSKAEIKKLNKKYRGKDEPTDVLSFSAIGGPASGGEDEYLGEVVICPEIAKTEKEMTKVFIHGVLHLCGYDHEKSKKEAELMEQKQNKYLSEINV